MLICGNCCNMFDLDITLFLMQFGECELCGKETICQNYSRDWLQAVRPELLEIEPHEIQRTGRD